MPKKIRRAWINQPSSLQCHHNLNGENVLVVDTKEKTVDIYFTRGNVISMRIPRNCLSIGNFAPGSSDTPL